MRFLFLLLLASAALAQSPKLPKLLDPALKLEALCSVPDIEAPTTVVGAPDGSFYVGCDLRDGRLNTDKPECYIVRYSSMSADKKRTVFAKDIFSPAGSAWHDGWLYVAHDPFLTRFKDTDADGIADVREDLITNLGKRPDTGLNDHLASGFTLGMDGFFYMSIGDRGTYQTKSVKDGSTISLQGGGIIRFRPDGTALEIFSSGTRNHLAVLLDAEDNAFTLDNTDDGNGWWTRLTHHIEGGYYGYPYDYQHAPNYGVTQPSKETLDAMKRNGHAALIISPEKSATDEHGLNTDGKKPDQIPSSSSAFHPWNSVANTQPFLPAIADFGGGSPTGGLCYLSDGLPEQYRGKLLFSEWGKGGLFVIEVARDGATFRFVKNTPLIQGGNGIDFRPMQISVAADGSLLIADWQWGGWKGPKTVGTVWRLSWPEAKPAPRLKDESTATVEELLAALAHPDRDQRLRAQRRLAETPDANFEKVTNLAGDSSIPPLQRIHAMWATQGISEALITKWLAEPEEDRPERLYRRSMAAAMAAFACAKNSDSAVKIQAARIYGHRSTPWGGRLPTSKGTNLIEDLLKDTNAGVRCAAALAFGRSTGAEDDKLLVVLGDPDAWVRFAVRPAIAVQGEWICFQELEPFLDQESHPDREQSAWQAITGVFNTKEADPENFTVTVPGYSALEVLERKAKSTRPVVRCYAIAAFGRVAYKSKPWDGHWWGTQPVKNPPPLDSVAWEGTPAALQALTAALSDSDAGVRLAAAKAFSLFIMPAPAAAGKPVPQAAVTNGRDAMAHLSDAEAIRCDPETIRIDPEAIRTDPEAIRTDVEVTRTDAEATRTGAEATRIGPETLLLAAADAPKPAEASPVEQKPALPESELVARALATLKSRLTVETDAAVRRQLIESLGVQRDPGAMKAFMDIALDEKADAGFREAAINAVVNMGGDDARKTIAQLAAAPLSPAATRKIIQAAGELKVLEAAPALIAHLSDENAGNRESAAKSLARLGPKSGALDGLVTALADKDAKVQIAAVEAIGSFKDKRALPALLDFSKTKRARRETINAVGALMPDTQALPFLVDALREKGTGERRDALNALKKMRAEAWPLVEENLASGRIPAEFATEIRMVFDSGVIAKWRMIGPFENVWEAVHPPEKDALTYFTVAGKTGTVPAGPHWSTTAEKLLGLRYINAEGKEVGWMDVTASADEGRVNLEKVFKSNGMVCAYAFTEIESPEDADAKLLCGSDDQIAVWLNGKKLHDSGAGSRGFNADQDEVPVHFAKGRNALLVKIGNVGGGWEFAARIPGVDGGKFVPNKEPAPDVKQRAYALATKPDGSWVNRGDAKRGEKLFFDQTAALGGLCATCHKVRGLGKEVGPDLSLVGSIYKRGDLIVSILEPSKTIALGFDQNMIETKGGETFIGALRQETADAFTLVGADGQPHVVKKTDVKTRKPIELSLMPPGLTLALKPEDFTDLLAFLETLK